MLPKGLFKEYSLALSWLIRAMDACSILIAGFLAYWFKFDETQLPGPYWLALGAAAILTPFVFRLFHVYDSTRGKGIAQHLRNVAQGIFTVLVLLAVFIFFTKSGEEFSRAWFGLWMSFAFLFICLVRFCLLTVLRFMRTRGWNERRILILGNGEMRDEVYRTIQEVMWTGFRIVAVFDEKPADLSQYLTQNQIDEIWMIFPLSAEEKMKAIRYELRHETVTLRLFLDIFSLNLLNHSMTNVAGFPVLNICSSPMVGWNRLKKAIEDRFLALMILLISSPLFLAIAIAVKYSSKGPVFYRQKRVSWNGKEFDMLKFRSMPVDAEQSSGPVWAKAEDQRATKIGAFLRQSSLDEIPQFINVLLGDMSIVGPRPERLVFVDEFKHKIPGYMQKHLVKAGITGWAQVNGWRGNTSLEKRIEYDLYYIQHWSVLFDIKIIFLTLFRGFFNKNAY